MLYISMCVANLLGCDMLERFWLIFGWEHLWVQISFLDGVTNAWEMICEKQVLVFAKQREDITFWHTGETSKSMRMQRKSSIHLRSRKYVFLVGALRRPLRLPVAVQTSTLTYLLFLLIFRSLNLNMFKRLSIETYWERCWDHGEMFF